MAVISSTTIANTNFGLLPNFQFGRPGELATSVPNGNSGSEWLTSTQLSKLTTRDMPRSQQERLPPAPFWQINPEASPDHHTPANWSYGMLWNYSETVQSAGVEYMGGQSFDDLSMEELLKLCRKDPVCWSNFLENSELPPSPSTFEFVLVSIIYVFTILIGLVSHY